jgi:hypothetical protein
MQWHCNLCQILVALVLYWRVDNVSSFWKSIIRVVDYARGSLSGRPEPTTSLAVRMEAACQINHRRREARSTKPPIIGIWSVDKALHRHVLGVRSKITSLRMYCD